MKQVLADFVELIEDYTETREMRLIEGETVEKCAEHVMNWCYLNNHDMDSIPYSKLENIINLYYYKLIDACYYE